MIEKLRLSDSASQSPGAQSPGRRKRAAEFKTKTKNKPMLSKSPSLKHLQLNAFGYATWKSYSNLRKKAVEQEFTWSGFVISLSIAFLFVFSSSFGLNALYEKTLDKNLTYSESSHTLIIESVPVRVLAFGSTC